MNLCIFSGRVTKDAETRYTQSGKPVSNFGLAVDAGYGDNKTTVFLNCVMWSNEKLAGYLVKGKPIIVRGEYGERKYTDKNGQERRIVEINVRDVEFQQGQPKQGGQSQNTPSQSQNDPDSIPF